jgi:hypothetical protein
MSEEAKDGVDTSVSDDAEQKPDPITNLKAEYSRKFDGINAQLAAQNAQMQEQLNAILQTMTAKQTAAAGGEAKLSDLIYNDPDRAAAIMEQNASAKAANAAVAAVAGYQERQSTLTTLAQQYPELSDSNSELAKAATAAYNALPARLKDTPEGYRMVIRETAADLGLLPVSKRAKAESNEDFSVSSGGGQRKSANRSKDSDLSADTIDFARLSGLNVDDPKVLASLKQRAKRTNYKKYE